MGIDLTGKPVFFSHAGDDELRARNKPGGAVADYIPEIGQEIPLGAIMYLPKYSAADDHYSGYYRAVSTAVPNRTTYSAFFALVSTNFGVGNGTTTFNIPSLPFEGGVIGVDGSNVWDTEYGENTVTLTTAEMAAHAHGYPLDQKSDNGASNPDTFGSEVSATVAMEGSTSESATTNAGTASPTAHNNQCPYHKADAFVKIDDTDPDICPTGSVMPYAPYGIGGVTIPTGYLQCDGSAVSRTTYADLFAVIGTTYGVGDGTTTFNLPDCRGRFVIGAGAGGGLTSRSLGATGGANSVSLATAELPAHNHTSQDHYHYSGSGRYKLEQGASPYTWGLLDWDPGNTQNAGSGTAHENRHKCVAYTYIIAI